MPLTLFIAQRNWFSSYDGNHLIMMRPYNTFQRHSCFFFFSFLQKILFVAACKIYLSTYIKQLYYIFNTMMLLFNARALRRRLLKAQTAVYPSCHKYKLQLHTNNDIPAVLGFFFFLDVSTLKNSTILLVDISECTNTACWGDVTVALHVLHRRTIF